MIETTDYYIYEDSFIFKPDFNGFLNNYINIISNYKKIFFSNYNESVLCVETNNKYYDIYYKKYKFSSFNQPLGDSLKNQIQLQQLIFGRNFNQLLGDSLNYLRNLQQLTFGWEFNQPLGNSLKNQIQLQQLTFGRKFNQPLDDLLNNLKKLQELTLDNEFNMQIDIPTNIKILKLNCNNIYVIDNLPNSIEELYLLDKFNLELNNLPNSIKIISLHCGYNKKLNNINPKCLIVYNSIF